MTLPDECPVEEEEEEVRFRPERHTLTFEFEEEPEEVMRGTNLEAAGPEEGDGFEVFGESPVESFSGSMELDPERDPLAHRLLTATPRGAGKSWLNHFYGRSAVERGGEHLDKLYPNIDIEPPTREDAEAVLAWSGFGATARAEAVRRRREREERDLPGTEPSVIVCAHCGGREYELSEGTIEREGEWYCGINCLNAEVGP